MLSRQVRLCSVFSLWTKSLIAPTLHFAVSLVLSAVVAHSSPDFIRHPVFLTTRFVVLTYFMRHLSFQVRRMLCDSHVLSLSLQHHPRFQT